jgi:RNA polymerase sigma-70 factor (ECF subfamily)
MDVEAQVRAELARGDPDSAATAAIEGYGPGIFGYLCTMLDEDDARDAFSLFAEDLWKGLPAFRGECTVRAWSYRLAWHAAARFSRQAWLRRRERLPSSAASRLAASVASGSRLGEGGRRDRLAALRAQLTPEERTLLTLRVDRELEWDEVAEVLRADGVDVSTPALRKRFERLKERIAVLARERGLLD